MFKERVFIFFIGLICFSLGIAQAVKVQYLGIHPWEVLNVGLFHKFGLSIGSWSIIIGLILIIVTFILDRSYIHMGTFVNVFLVGFAVDFILWLDIVIDSKNLVIDTLLLIFSMILMGLGGGMNNAARLGSGPRDGFMLVISDWLKFSIQRVRIFMETLVIIIGIVIGGPVFIFTFIYTLIQSPMFQFAFLKVDSYFKKIEEKRKEFSD